MNKYNQITVEERYHIYAYKKAVFCPKEIAQMLERHKSAIYRELNRNKGERGYRPKQAHEKASHRRQAACKTVKMTPGLVKLIESKISEDWSPDLAYFFKQSSLPTFYRVIPPDHMGVLPYKI
jgi:IS30 family transposase